MLNSGRVNFYAKMNIVHIEGGHFMVRKINFLLIASIVWLVAGFNVIKIGVETYTNHLSALNFIVTILVFLIFGS